MNKSDKKLQEITDKLLESGVSEKQVYLALETSKNLREILNGQKTNFHNDPIHKIYDSISKDLKK